MYKNSKIAFLFPGQGAQYPMMGKDFYENFEIVRETFEEGNEILKRNLSNIILKGSEQELTQTSNSQPAIFLLSAALTKLISQIIPDLKPDISAGLSLGEYSALYAGGFLSFASCLKLVDLRSRFMHEACENTKGAMAVILGLESDQVEKMVDDLKLTNDLWPANFNCPGQVVISGTLLGIEKGTARAKELGAKRVLPLSVHGAFHSGLMKSAELKLAEFIHETTFREGQSQLVMNFPGDYVDSTEQIKINLIKQVTGPVRWEQSIKKMDADGINTFIEVGCGKVLSGFNKKIGVLGQTLNIETLSDFEKVVTILRG